MDEIDLAKQLERVELLEESNARRLDEMEKRQDNLDKLVTSVEVLATKQQAMETDVKEIKADVKSMAEKPGKRWETVKDKIIWAVLAAVIAFLLGRIGL